MNLMMFIYFSTLFFSIFDTYQKGGARRFGSVAPETATKRLATGKVNQVGNQPQNCV
jgi:hypothetical protein